MVKCMGEFQRRTQYYKLRPTARGGHCGHDLHSHVLVQRCDLVTVTKYYPRANHGRNYHGRGACRANKTSYILVLILRYYVRSNYHVLRCAELILKLTSRLITESKKGWWCDRSPLNKLSSLQPSAVSPKCARRMNCVIIDYPRPLTGVSKAHWG